MTGSQRTVQVAADVFRAQALAQMTTYAMKYSIRRTRPDGTRFSFPSGHTSVTFASATALHRNFGWKVGVPAYGVAAYVAGSRLQTRRHHLSDVVFGAALGITAGRSVTIGRGKSRLAVAPVAVPGGSGVTITLLRP
jgi:membrane-associated phospholipid phosphatase